MRKNSQMGRLSGLHHRYWARTRHTRGANCGQDRFGGAEHCPADHCCCIFHWCRSALLQLHVHGNEVSSRVAAALLFIDSLAQAFVVCWYICGITFGATTTPGSKGICGCNNGDQLRRSRVGAVPNRGLAHFIFGTYSIDLGWYRNRTGIQYKAVATEDMAMTGQPT